jgi:cell division protein FtsB
MKLLLIIMSLLLVLLLAGLWVGSGSYPERWKIQERSASQELSNTQREEQINKIKAELDDASSGNAAIEERARSELGMMGKGETFYEVVLQPEINDSATKNQKKSLEIKNPESDGLDSSSNNNNSQKENE